MMPLVCFKLPADLWALTRRNVEMVATPERPFDFMKLLSGDRIKSFFARDGERVCITSKKKEKKIKKLNFCFLF